VLREIVHVCRHAPATLALKRRVPQDELYAELIGRADRAGLADRRRELVAGLGGHVLELGCGTGAMFPYYEGVRVTGLEPDEAFAERARAAARGKPIEVVIGSGEAMPFGDHGFDAAVIALVLCSVPDVDRVCRELARVVKPGGAVRLIEHVRSERRVAGALMRAVNPLWLRVNGQGCNLDRDPLPALERAGIRVESSEPFQIWSAGLPAFPMRLVRARRV
jgi:ubiquinone/menaquinone biosynthesis C-methylase UbiE